MKPYDPIAEYCQEWVRWSQTRRFYMKPPAASLLARLQPSKSGEEPNARNSPDMQYFNMAIHTMADMKEWGKEAPVFMQHYAGAGRPAKCKAADLGISLRTYYNYLKRFSAGAYSLAASIKNAHEALGGGGSAPAAAPATGPITREQVEDARHLR